jgi:hypothetical protein
MIINFRLNKISIEKKNIPKGSIEAKNNLRITDVREESISSLTKEKALNLDFVFKVMYEPKVAEVEMQGNVTFMNDAKAVKDILENWQKNKKIKQEVAVPIFNHILSKCNVKALALEEDVELPFHVPIPRVKTKAEMSQPAKAS